MGCAGDFRHESVDHFCLRELLNWLVARLDVEPLRTCFVTQHPDFEALVVLLCQDIKVDRWPVSPKINRRLRLFFGRR